MLGRQMKLVGIERDIPLVPVVLYSHAEQFPYDFMIPAVAAVGLYLRDDGLPQPQDNLGKRQARLGPVYHGTGDILCLDQDFQVVLQDFTDFGA